MRICPGLDIMVVQIDGIHISEHLVLVAALGIDSEGFKHPLNPRLLLASGRTLNRKSHRTSEIHPDPRAG